ncbi:MAG: orotate phosphoribosyltransferase [Bacteroidota bacterium]|nr:orotate phosphoribosyltransferase [Bacteroidota bacterium]
MIFDIDIAKQVAKSLLQIKAIILQPNNPFVWASGWLSPIYCDNRKILSFPKERTFIRQNLVNIIRKQYQNSNIVAGVATGGIPHGILVAEELGLPFIYVRSSVKEHGKQNQIEGHYNERDSVIMIEDLISTGKSSLDARRAIQDAKLDVKAIISIFNYGFKKAEKNFKKETCEYVSLCNYKILLEEALKINYINKKDIPLLESWSKAPEKWNPNG